MPRKASLNWTKTPGWLYWPAIKWLRHPNVQLRIGGYGFVVVSVVWATVTLYARLVEGAWAPGGEPPGVWHMSAAAIWFSLLTLVIVTDVGETVK